MTKKILNLLFILIVTGCHRPTHMTRTYSIPALDTQQKANALKNVLNTRFPNALQSIEADLQSRTVTITFDEQSCRTMNIEQLIAETGFAVNHRPGLAQKTSK